MSLRSNGVMKVRRTDCITSRAIWSASCSFSTTTRQYRSTSSPPSSSLRSASAPATSVWAWRSKRSKNFSSRGRSFWNQFITRWLQVQREQRASTLLTESIRQGIASWMNEIGLELDGKLLMLEPSQSVRLARDRLQLGERRLTPRLGIRSGVYELAARRAALRNTCPLRLDCRARYRAGRPTGGVTPKSRHLTWSEISQSG